MPDPFDALPYELWIRCVEAAIYGREAGPLGLLGVSRRWDRLLLDSPSLWSQIYIQNGEDEMARIFVFLYFSKGCSLHVNIMTALPSMESLQLITDHISRVATISIRPGPSDNIAALHMERWKQAAPHTLARLSNGPLVPDVTYASCFGVSLQENNQFYHPIILMQFTLATTTNNANKQNCSIAPGLPVTACSQMWEEHVTRAISISADQDANARTDSVYSLGKLASYAQYYSAIRIAIPSFMKLLKDYHPSVRLATLDTLHKFAFHIELRATLGRFIPSLITLLGDRHSDVVLAVVSLLERLVEHEGLPEAMWLTIRPLIKLLGHEDSDVRSAAVSLIQQLAEHDELRGELELTILPLIKLLGHKNSDFLSAAVSLLVKLAEHGELRRALGLAIPWLTEILEHEYGSTRWAAVSLLDKLAEYDELQKALRSAILPLLKLLQHDYSSFRSTALLAKLADKQSSRRVRHVL